MMNDASTPIGQPAAVTPPGKLAYATPTTAPLVAGRRSFFKYRDLGVAVSRLRMTDGSWSPRQWAGGRFPWLLRDPSDLGFLDHYQRVLANSEYTRSWVKRLWGVDAEVLFPPIRVQDLRPGPKQRRILTVGRFIARRVGHSKKQLELVQAFGRMVRRGGMDGWELHVVGGCEPSMRPYLTQVERAADRQHDEVHRHDDQPGLAERGGDPLGEALRHLVVGEDPARRRAAHDHQHDNAGRHARLDNVVAKALPRQVAVEEGAQRKGIDDRQHRDLGRRRDTKAQADQDQDRQDELHRPDEPVVTTTSSAATSIPPRSGSSQGGRTRSRRHEDRPAHDAGRRGGERWAHGRRDRTLCPVQSSLA